MKAVQKFKFVKYYSFYLRGYSEARMVLVDLALSLIHILLSVHRFAG